MKKQSVIIVALILFVSTIGLGPVLGCYIPYFESQQTTVHVGDTITVVAINHSGNGCISPSAVLILQEDCSTPSNKVVYITSKCEGDKLTLTYKAVNQGTVKFKYETCTQTVKILPKPHPMFFFMKILGLGKSD